MTDHIGSLVNIVDLKNLARQKLPPSSALRDLILSEPDYVPENELLVKLRLYSRLPLPRGGPPGSFRVETRG